MNRLIGSVGLGLVVALAAGSAFAQAKKPAEKAEAASAEQKDPADEQGDGATSAEGDQKGDAAGDAAGEDKPKSMSDSDEEGVAFSTEDEPPSGMTFKFGLRLGYALPGGDAHEGTPPDGAGAALASTFAGHIPIWVDVGLKVTPNVMVGIYAQYGIAMIAGDLCPSDDCGGSINRIGIQGQYEISPGEFLNPWFGLGFGYEWAHSSGQVQFAPGDERDTAVTLRGFEFVNLQAGLLFRVYDKVDVGPYVSLSAGMYDEAKAEVDGERQPWAYGTDEVFGDPQLHQWISFGVRGTYEYWPF